MAKIQVSELDSPQPTSTDEEQPPHSAAPKRTLSFPALSLERLAAFDATDADTSAAPTPGLVESGKQLKRNLSFKVLREADATWVKRTLWRPGEDAASPKRRPQDLDQLIAWSIRGGCRAFLLAFAARSGFNVILVLLSSLRRRQPRRWTRLLLHAIFGATAVRFGLMFSLFASTYRFLYNGLRIWNPGQRGPGREERWHAALSGAVASFALLAERPSSRSGAAQQIFVRGLQGIYHRLAKQGLHIPHGDVLLFGASCSFIMNAWINAPQVLEKGYRDWITSASRMPAPLAPWQAARYRGRPVDLTRSGEFLSWHRGVDPQNKYIMLNYIQQARQGHHGPPFTLCAFNHPQTTRCSRHWLHVFTSVSRWILPVYLPLTFIPPLLFRYAAVQRKPVDYILRSISGTLSSSAFVGLFVTIFQAQICSQRHIYDFLSVRRLKTLAKAAGHRWWTALFGFMTCIALFVERKSRREELAIYVLPKAMAAFWRSLQIKSGFKLPHGEVLLNIIGVALLTDTWRHHREALSGLVRTILWQAIGQ